MVVKRWVVRDEKGVCGRGNSWALALVLALVLMLALVLGIALALMLDRWYEKG